MVEGEGVAADLDLHDGKQNTQKWWSNQMSACLSNDDEHEHTVVVVD